MVLFFYMILFINRSLAVKYLEFSPSMSMLEPSLKNLLVSFLRRASAFSSLLPGLDPIDILRVTGMCFFKTESISFIKVSLSPYPNVSISRFVPFCILVPSPKAVILTLNLNPLFLPSSKVKG